MTTLYDGFDIESFEAGKGLWHARIRRADFSPVAIDGVLFPAMEVGFAWPDVTDEIHHLSSLESHVAVLTPGTPVVLPFIPQPSDRSKDGRRRYRLTGKGLPRGAIR